MKQLKQFILQIDSIVSLFMDATLVFFLDKQKIRIVKRLVRYVQLILFEILDH